MNTGTICDLDTQGGFGLIDADDGRIVCFNRNNVADQQGAKLHVGTRVAFAIDSLSHDAHVAQVRLWSTRYSEN